MMTYMAHWRERRVSLVVSINAFNGECLNEITEDLADIIVDHLSYEMSTEQSAVSCAGGRSAGFREQIN